MSAARRWVVALWLLLVAAPGFAAGTCYQWRFVDAAGHSTGYKDSASEALAAVVAHQNDVHCSTSCVPGSYAIASVTPGTFPAYSFVLSWVAVATGQTTYNTSDSLSSRVNPEGCPECLDSGTPINMVADPANAPAMGSTVCESGCIYEYTATDLDVHGGATDSSIWGYHSKGQACGSTSGGGLLDQDSPLEPDNCASGSAGVYCNSSPGQNCGTFNGDEVCVESISPGTCVSYASGGVACVAASGSAITSPPAPDNGTAGSPANPSGSVELHVGGSTITANYYGAGTVGDSGTEPTTTGAQGGGAEEEEAGSASGGGSCDAAPACTGDSIQCAILAQQWKARCPDALSEGELQSAVGSVDMPASTVDLPGSLSESGPVALSVAACPAPPTITVFGTVIALNWITYLCSFAAQVSAIVMVAGYLVAVKVLIGWGAS